jgi:hypothetical protein
MIMGLELELGKRRLCLWGIRETHLHATQVLLVGYELMARLLGWEDCSSPMRL